MTLLAEEPVAPASGSDRRRSPREERLTPAWLSAAAGSKSGNGFNVQVRDLSLHGVGFISSRKLDKNQSHWMVIADRSLRLSTRVRIAAVRERTDGQYDIGAEFF
jgi:hypothetical protein